MKIGILTYHRSQNYGAQLQAFALQQYVASLGHDVCIIDYWPRYHSKIYKPTLFQKELFVSYNCKIRIKYVLACVALWLYSNVRRMRTQRFVCKYFNLQKITQINNCDLVIYGSDQIWRKQHVDTCFGYNPIYFGANYNGIKVSYAASMGKIEVDSDDDIAFLRSHLSRFKAISVREKDLYNFIHNKISLNSQLVCDPVLLLKKDYWQSLVKDVKSSPYIFVYNIANVDGLNKIAEEMHQYFGYKVIELKGYVDRFYSSSNIVYTADAIEFLSYLVNAEYIVTSSFHGVALSLCFEKQFIFKSTSYLSNRTESLLSLVDLSNRNFSQIKFSINSIYKSIDYMYVRPLLSKFIVNSQEWLLNKIHF